MRYAIRSIDPHGVIETIDVDADNEGAARAQLEALGRAVVAIRRAKGVRGGDAFPLTVFTRELLALIEAGLALKEALAGLAERETGAAAKRVLTGLLSDIERGMTPSQAMAARPSAFPALYVASVHAAQTTGSIAPALARYLEYRVTVDAVRKKLITASIYPALLMIVGGAIILFLLLFVVPRFALVYADRKSDALPFLAQMLLKWGGFAGQYASLFIGGFIVLIVSAAWAFRSGALQAGLLRILTISRRFRDLMELFALSRFYRTTGMLLSGGYSLLEAIRMALELLPAATRVRMEVAAIRIGEGLPPSVAFEANKLVTPVALRLIAAGERSGDLAGMLKHVADFHDAELQQSVDVFLRLFEPLLMLVIGGVVGTIIVLMYLPIFELVGGV